jgi:hypothetical protein
LDNPSTAEVDSALIPRTISWISKNPHVPGDGLPDEAYRKTIVCNVPPTARIGTIKVSNEGEVTYEGEYCTPRSPNGKNAADLDETEKDNFLAFLHDEMNAADDFQRELSTVGMSYFRTDAGLSSLLPLAVRVTAPAAARAGSVMVWSAAATRPWGAAAATVRYEWRFSNGAIFTGKTVRVTFKNSGTFNVRLTVRDRFGATTVSTREFTVGPSAQ